MDCGNLSLLGLPRLHSALMHSSRIIICPIPAGPGNRRSESPSMTIVYYFFGLGLATDPLSEKIIKEY